MDHTRDNPLKRFTAFWIAILLVFCFGVGLIILRPLTQAKADTAYEMKSEQKLKIKADIDKAQTSALNVNALEKAIKDQAKSFSSNTEAAGSMAIPGAAPAPSETPAE